MKEIIYVDMEIINSYLAQLDEGLVSGITTSATYTQQNGEETGSQSETSVDGGVNIGVGQAKLTRKEQDIVKQNIVYSSSNKDLLNTVLDDYSLDILLQKLEEEEYLAELNDELEEGKFVLHTGSFQVFNFNLLADSMKSENVNLFNNSEIFNQTLDREIEVLNNQKANKNAKVKQKLEQEIKNLRAQKLPPNKAFENFEHAYRFGKFGSVLFPDSSLFKIDNVLALCSNKNFRLNSETLVFLNSTKRKITILGTVIFKREKNIIEKDSEGNVIQVPTDKIASSSQLMFSELILDNLELSSIGDYYIRPIAIYFS